VDSTWLKEQIQKLLEKNRVREVRSWKGITRECIYHAPLLDPEIEYPRWLPSAFQGLWRLWWRVKLPWHPNYPHQWFWDSCAFAIVLSSLDIELAQKEIESLLYAQREDGFIPHMIWNSQKMHWVDRILQWLYRSRHTSPYLQPPALAEAVERILERSADIKTVLPLLPAVEKYYTYLDRERRRGEDGLVEIIISYESGKDRSPEYDPVYGSSNTAPVWRGPMLRLMIRHWRAGWNPQKIFAGNWFQVKDLLFNCVYAQNLLSLSRLCQAADRKREAQIFHQRALQAEESILSKMYDPETGLFYSLDSRYGRDRLVKVNTVSSLMPLVLDTISQAQVERLVKEHLYNSREFWTEYPIPAEPLSSVTRDERKHIIWRGLQTWIYTNWYIARGLRKQAQRFPQHRQEYTQIADELTFRSYELVRREGFCDFYHAQTGQGSIARDFGWSALILDMVEDMERAASTGLRR
jgi:hypothetical protein